MKLQNTPAKTVSVSTLERFELDNMKDKEKHVSLCAQAAQLRESGDFDKAVRIDRKADRIAEAFVERNRGWAVTLTKPFMRSRSAGAGDDLMAVAVASLWKAFVAWDQAVGSFASFSKRHITGAVRREVAFEEFPQMSYGDFSARPAVKAAQQQLETALNRSPSFAEIAHRAGVTVSLVERALSARPVSLNGSLNGPADMTEWFVADVEAPSRDAVADVSAIRKNIASVLDDRELFVMLRRTGLDGGDASTLNDIGQLAAVSREAIRRQERTASFKLSGLLEL